jgi:hypothetical protein
LEINICKENKIMDSKDFKKIIEEKLKEDNQFNTWAKGAKERTSRPRVVKNILQPDHEGLNNMYGYYSNED